MRLFIKKYIPMYEFNREVTATSKKIMPDCNLMLAAASLEILKFRLISPSHVVRVIEFGLKYLGSSAVGPLIFN